MEKRVKAVNVTSVGIVVIHSPIPLIRFTTYGSPIFMVGHEIAVRDRYKSQRGVITGDRTQTPTYPLLLMDWSGKQQTMGEAKRRKQALGEHYGDTPPVLIKGSETLQKQTEKFVDDYFAKLEQLNNAKPAEVQLENEQETTSADSQPQQDVQILEMQQWVQAYFEPYRPKDREQLVMGLLKPFYFVLFEAPPDFFKEEAEEEKGTYLTSLIGSLTSLSILRSYLSEAKLEEYIEPMRSLYWEMLDTLEDEEVNTDDFTSQAKSLTQLFQACLNEEDIPEYVSS